MLILLSEKLLDKEHLSSFATVNSFKEFVLSDLPSSRFVFYWFISLTVLLFHASPSIHSSLYMPVCHLYVCLSVCLSIYQAVCRSVCLSSFLSVCLSVYQASVCLSSYLFFCLSLSSCLSVGLSVCLSVCQVVCLSVCLSVCPVHPSVSISGYKSIPNCPSLNIRH